MFVSKLEDVITMLRAGAMRHSVLQEIWNSGDCAAYRRILETVERVPERFRERMESALKQMSG